MAMIVLGFLLVLASLGVILCKKPVHSCLSFLLTLLLLAGLYLNLQAPFISAMQILVYAGAILVIFMFVIVLFQDAYLAIEERLLAAKIIRRMVQAREQSAFIVDHDIVFQDYVSDRLSVFLGEPGTQGTALSPAPLKNGMNRFLSNLDVTFRRDPTSGRPRVNKAASRLDKEQKAAGNYYYAEGD